MATHAFRVLEFALFANGRGDPLELDDGNRRAFASLLEYMSRLGTLYGWPNARGNGEADDGQSDPVVPALTIQQVVWVTSSHLHVALTQGERGGHSLYNEPGGTSTDISAGSAEARYRVDFFFPNDGTTGLLATEVISNSDPTRLLLVHIAATARRVRDKQKADLKADRARRRAAGEPAPPTPIALVPRWSRVADPDKLREILDAAERTEVEFSEFAQSSRGGEGTVRKRRLAVRLTDDLEFERAISTINGWWRTMNDDRAVRVSKRAAVLQARADFEGDDLGNIDFDDVKIVVTPKIGSSRTFAPDMIREMFTYSLTQGRTTMMYYYEKVGTKVRGLAANHGLPLTLATTEEVVECLQDLTPAPSSEASDEGSAIER